MGQTGVGHHQIPGRVVNTEILLPEPVNQRLVIRSVKDIRQGVFATRLMTAQGHRQQMQVVIAKHDDRRIPKALDVSQGFQRGRAAVDQIAGHP